MVSPLGVAVCRCKSGYFPKPDTITGCGHQCDDDDDCSNSQNCANGRCVNICEEGICGVNALCEPRNRRAICRCPSGYSGDPFTRCSAGQTGKTKVSNTKRKKEKLTGKFHMNRSTNFDRIQQQSQQFQQSFRWSSPDDCHWIQRFRWLFLLLQQPVFLQQSVFFQQRLIL